MKKSLLYAAWGGMFVLCAGLGFLQEPKGAARAALTVISLLFFCPPAALLWQACGEGDRRTAAIPLKPLIQRAKELITMRNRNVKIQVWLSKKEAENLQKKAKRSRFSALNLQFGGFRLCTRRCRCRCGKVRHSFLRQ